MFRKELKAKLKDIFAVKRVTFDVPGDEVKGSSVSAGEHEVLFVTIEDVKSTVKDGRLIAKIQGKASMVAEQDEMPYGYFQKRIYQAGAKKTTDFFFYQMDENAGKIGDLTERTFSFVFFYNSQYDPALGTITSIEFEGID